MTDRKIETIEDVREALADVRQALADVQQVDFDDPEARVLVQPLLELQDALARTAAQISGLTRSGPHRRVRHGLCPVCRHYGSDCRGT